MSLGYTVGNLPQGLQQGLELFPINAQSLCVSVGSFLYYFTNAQEGVAEATDNLWIIKSSDGGNTWILVYNGTRTITGVAVGDGFFDPLPVVVGSSVYLPGKKANGFGGGNMAFAIWDTSTDSFPGVTSLGPAGSSNTSGPSAAATALFPNGQILLAYYTSTGTFVISYDPSTDSWGTSASLGGSGIYPCGIAMQASTNRAYLFWQLDPTLSSGRPFPSTTKLQCASVTYPNTVGTVQTLLNSQTESFQGDYPVGVPCVTANDAEVVMPYLNPQHYNTHAAGNQALVVFRAACAADPTFTSETVQTALGPSLGLSTYQPHAMAGCCALSLGGLLYVFYWADNNQGFAGTSTSQAWLVYKTNNGAGLGWSLPTTVYQSTVPGEGENLCPVAISSSEAGLFFLTVNPVTVLDTTDPGVKYASFTAHYMNLTTQGPVPGGPGGGFSAEPSANAIGPGNPPLGPVPQFLLQRVVVTMKPDKRMPVRGAAQ